MEGDRVNDLEQTQDFSTRRSSHHHCRVHKVTSYVSNVHEVTNVTRPGRYALKVYHNSEVSDRPLLMIIDLFNDPSEFYHF